MKFPREDEVFHLTYDLRPHAGGIQTPDVPDGHGACDEVLLASIRHQPGVGASVSFISLDGTKGTEYEPISAARKFKVWTMLTEELSEDQQLGPIARKVCSVTMDHVRLAYGIFDALPDDKPPEPSEGWWWALPTEYPEGTIPKLCVVGLVKHRRRGNFDVWAAGIPVPLNPSDWKLIKKIDPPST